MHFHAMPIISPNNQHTTCTRTCYATGSVVRRRNNKTLELHTMLIPYTSWIIRLMLLCEHKRPHGQVEVGAGVGVCDGDERLDDEERDDVEDNDEVDELAIGVACV